MRVRASYVCVCECVSVWTRKIFAILRCEQPSYPIIAYIRVEHSSVFTLLLLHKVKTTPRRSLLVQRGNTRKSKLTGPCKHVYLMKCFIAVLHLVVVLLLLIYFDCVCWFYSFVLYCIHLLAYISYAWDKSGCNILQQ